MHHIREIIYIFCLLPFTAFSTNTEDQNSKLDFTPTEYDLSIKTSEEHFKNSTKQLFFSGTVNIHLNKTVKEDENLKIILNISNETKIENIVFKGANKTLKLEPTRANETLVVKVIESVKGTTNFELSINFSNPFGNDMSGFYRSSYTTKNSETRWLLTTHFEPIFARKAFPCFDVPNIKTNFQITIHVPKSNNNYSVLCNTPLEGKPEIVENDRVFKCKKTTSPMSSYLVAFTVSDFDSTDVVKFESTYKESELGKERKIVTYGREEMIKSGDGALSLTVAKEAVTKLAEYLGIGYAFEKIDQVGIPDFSAGAMENWGHISYREKYLFFNDLTGATLTKQSIVLTITHELVHQWFGNLVTLDSWDYIWLNEAFATYVSYVIAAKIQNPNTTNWEYMTQFLTDETHLRAFETDGLNSSKPLSNEIKDESLIFSSFNDIPYSKGASVLRMWDLALDKALFEKSLHCYLNNRKEKSAKPSHLRDAFKSEANMNEKFFNSWTEKAGYPVVSVKTINATHYNLTQKRFLWEKPEKEDTTKWTIPITFMTEKLKKNDTKPQYWLEGDSTVISADGKWMILNYKQAGYYRVNYERKNWEALAEALNQKDFSGIHEFNRAQIINDVYSLARSVQDNYVHYSIALRLTEYLSKENSYIAWKTALHSFEFLQAKIYDDEKYYGKFKEYILKLLTPHFKGLNCTNQAHLEKLKKIQISRWACALDYEPCLKEAKQLYNSVTSLPDTQETILCTTVRTNDKSWDDVFKKYKEEMDSSKKAMYLSVLGCTENQGRIEAYLKLTLDEKSGIRKQDQMFVLSSVYNGNLKNVKLALKFVEDYFEKIAEDFGGINPLGRAVMGIAKKLKSGEDFKRMKALAEKIKKSEKTKAARDSVETALSIIQSNKKWAEEREEQFKSYLSGGSFLSYSIGLISLSSILIFQL